MQAGRVAAAAALLGDPSRAAMVLALMDGRSRSAKKLALDAGVSARTASTHLASWWPPGCWPGKAAAARSTSGSRAASWRRRSRRFPASVAHRCRQRRCCTDWTERRAHVAGALGAALLRQYLGRDWLHRVRDSRKLVVTPRGREMFVRLVGVEEAFFA